MTDIAMVRMLEERDAEIARLRAANDASVLRAKALDKHAAQLDAENERLRAALQRIAVFNEIRPTSIR